MVVSKSKFTSDNSKAAAIDVDDPLFWQKAMPNFVTPTLILQKLQDLEGEIHGATGRGKGRGRGRWKKKEGDMSESKDEKVSEAKQEATQDGKGEPMAGGEPNPVVEDPGGNSKKEDTEHAEFKDVEPKPVEQE
jgi:hypothetical protein